jgi:phosphoglycolate phosphatase-like HAD superfamily hydrolase
MGEKVVLDDKGLATLQEKLEKGEKISPEEEKEFMSVPNEERVELPAAKEDDDDTEVPETKETEEVKEADKNAAKKPEEKSAVPPVAPGPVDETKLAPAIKEELDKTEAEVDLRKFNKNEQALYWEAKRQRKRAQRAEEDRDGARFNLAKERAAKIEENKVPASDDPFAGREDDEFISVGDFRKSLTKQRDADAKRQEKLSQEQEKQNADMRWLKTCERECHLLYDDADEVLASAQELGFNDNSEYLRELGVAVHKGDNPAVKMYHILKSDPRFDNVIGRVRTRMGKKAPASEPAPAPMPAKPSEEEARLKQNQERTKTTGNVGGGGDAPVSEDDLELSDIAKMDDSAFIRLPKEKRDRFLKRFGA